MCIRDRADAFAAAGIAVLRCDLAFRQARPHGPPFPAMAVQDRAGLARAVRALRDRLPGKVFLGGHSYGGRQSSMLAAEEPELAAGLLLLSYPDVYKRQVHCRDVTLKKTRTAAAAKSAPAPEIPPLNSPQLYINRELSLLAFQLRVLEEAQDERNPLLDRVKFLSIVGSNMDEFFMVRVAGLIDQVDAGILDVGPDGMHPTCLLYTSRCV